MRGCGLTALCSTQSLLVCTAHFSLAQRQDRKGSGPFTSIKHCNLWTPEILGHKAISADESSAADSEARLQLRIIDTCFRLRCRDFEAWILLSILLSVACRCEGHPKPNASTLFFGPSLEECCYPFMVIWKGIIGCPTNSVPSRVFGNAVEFPGWLSHWHSLNIGLELLHWSNLFQIRDLDDLFCE